MSFHANQTPKTKTSQAIPTRAPPPPACLLNRRGDHPCSSPTSRSRVTPSVMRDGTRIRSRTETVLRSGIVPPDGRGPNSYHAGRGVRELPGANGRRPDLKLAGRKDVLVRGGRASRLTKS